jgi:hypothetical protein
MLQESLSALTTIELKAHLSKLRLSTSGNKDTLVQRLLSYCNIRNMKTLQQLDDIASDNEEEVLTSPQKVRVITKSNTEKGTMSWEIHQFSSLSLSPGEKLKSPDFTVGKHKWQVHLYPCGDKDDKEHVTCYLHHLERNDADAIAKWKASFKNKKGHDLRTSLELQFNFGKVKSRGWRGILTRNPLPTLPDDILIVESEIELFSEWQTSDNTEALANLQEEPIVVNADLQKDYETLLFNEALFSDVTFVVDGEKIPVHRNILCVRSSYFRGMFTSGLRESAEQVIALKDVDKVMFKELLRYIYCGNINEQVLHDQTIEILAIADKFDVEGLRNKCEALLLQRVTKSNASAILQAADTYHALKLKKRVLSVVTEHFLEIIATDAWKELCVHTPHLVGEITDAVAVKHGTKQASDDPNTSGVKRKRP